MQYLAGGQQVSCRANQGVRQSTALQPLHCAIEQRWQEHGVPDEAFQSPLSGKRSLACSNVPGKSVCGDLAGTMKRFRDRVRGQLGTSQGGVDAFTGKGIEEVGSVPDEERTVCHNPAGPGGEGSRDEDFANDTISRDSAAHSGKKIELLLKERSGPAFRLNGERPGDDQRDIGHASAESVEPDVSRATHMHLGHIAHSGDAGDMSDEGHPGWPAVSPPPDPARHDRAKAIGADGEARANCPPAAGGVAEHGATHGAVFIKESFQTHTIQHLSASAAGCVNQLLVENSPGDRETGISGQGHSCSREQSSQPASGRTDDCCAVEGGRTCRFQGWNHTKPFEQPDCLGAHVLGACFFTGEGRPINRDHSIALAREMPGRSTARRSRAYD